jgi:hypothetical protein
MLSEPMIPEAFVDRGSKVWSGAIRGFVVAFVLRRMDGEGKKARERAGMG